MRRPAANAIGALLLATAAAAAPIAYRAAEHRTALAALGGEWLSERSRDASAGGLLVTFDGDRMTVMAPRSRYPVRFVFRVGGATARDLVVNPLPGPWDLTGGFASRHPALRFPYRIDGDRLYLTLDDSAFDAGAAWTLRRVGPRRERRSRRRPDARSRGTPSTPAALVRCF